MIYLGHVPSKFLKAAGEIASGKKAVVLFLLFSGAQNEMEATSAQVGVGPDGLDVVR